MKEQEEYPEKELGKIEASNLLDVELKVMVIRTLKELSGTYISIKKDIETLNKNHLEMKNVVSEMKNTQKELRAGQTNQRIKTVIWKTRREKTHRATK